MGLSIEEIVETKGTNAKDHAQNKKVLKKVDMKDINDTIETARVGEIVITIGEMIDVISNIDQKGIETIGTKKKYKMNVV